MISTILRIPLITSMESITRKFVYLGIFEIVGYLLQVKRGE
jgi:hypothetical protein